MSYSLDFLKKILRLREEEGLTLEEVSKRFGVGVAMMLSLDKDASAVPDVLKVCHTSFYVLLQQMRQNQYQVTRLAIHPVIEGANVRRIG